ncbi:7-carboxy-7-deazaguanine synthase QueE [Paenibacillus agilis]|uniref:7-carboxy-7-deazaguanine synthase n=1 Tax=Paenibacillus agilis TaxID=3020863 RepID=A0A559ICC0_9BACL|nr:7-carboxy-7-deazaguanine synthase QueE [Paenibacillus agilis]TVX85160.1 7-carboxy-7-deazaguanine synthase QueE [Paenibacillus agilis]
MSVLERELRDRDKQSGRLPVLEIFGPTVQGEGLLIGQKTMFVRTAGCDYRCSWCDSAFTWDGSAKDEIKMLTAEQVWEQLQQLAAERFSHVTLSGGNPALLPQLGELVYLLQQRGVRTAVETQGSKWQPWLAEIDDVTVSPKPPSSGMNTDWERLDEVMDHLSYAERTTVCLKVVVFNEEDLHYAITVHERYPAVPFVLQTGNDAVQADEDMALVESLLRRYEWLIEQVAAESRLNDARVLPQLHTLVWGNKRGV